MVPDDGRWGAKIDRIKADKYRIEMPHTLEVFSDSTYRNEVRFNEITFWASTDRF